MFREKIKQNHFKTQLEWQLSVNHPIVLYCQYCYWGSSDLHYRYCPYGHGEMVPIAEYYEDSLEGL